MSKENENIQGSELSSYTARGWIKAFVLGIFIGLAVIVPGVSGSTVAIMFGLYASMLYAIGNIFKDFKRCVKFLIPIGIGAVIGFAAGFLLVQLLLEKYIFVVICLFVGLMIGASPALLNEIKGEKISGVRILLIAIGVLIPIGIGALSVYLDPPVLVESEGASQAFTSFPWYMFLLYIPLGVLISATQLIPGLSATAIMMALGQIVNNYEEEGVDFSNCKTAEEKIEVINTFEKARVEKEKEANADAIFNEELTASSLASIAASLEYQNMMTLDDVEV